MQQIMQIMRHLLLSEWAGVEVKGPANVVW